MTDKELLQKDWQLLTARCSLENEALLKIMLKYQARMLSLLTKKGYKEIIAEMNREIIKETDKIEELVSRRIPNYPKIPHQKGG